MAQAILAESEDLADSSTLDIAPSAVGSFEIQEIIVDQNCQLVPIWDVGDDGLDEHGYTKALQAGIHMGLKLICIHDGTRVKAGYRIKNNSGSTMDVQVKGEDLT